MKLDVYRATRTARVCERSVGVLTELLRTGGPTCVGWHGTGARTGCSEKRAATLIGCDVTAAMSKRTHVWLCMIESSRTAPKCNSRPTAAAGHPLAAQVPAHLT